MNKRIRDTEHDDTTTIFEITSMSNNIEEWNIWQIPR